MTKKKYSRLLIHHALIIFITTIITCILVIVSWILLSKFHLIPYYMSNRHVPILMFLIGSLLVSSMIAFFSGNHIILPIQNFCNAFDKLSRGDFSVRMSCHQKIPEIQEMAEKFNAAVFDLSHIETLRDDFVVNVSHEFKTLWPPLKDTLSYFRMKRKTRKSDTNILPKYWKIPDSFPLSPATFWPYQNWKIRKCVFIWKNTVWTSKSERTFSFWKANGRKKISNLILNFPTSCF